MVEIQPNGSKSLTISGDLFRIWKGQRLNLERNDISKRTTKEVKLLGITIDSKLQFLSHVETVCKTAKQNVKAFALIAG